MNETDHGEVFIINNDSPNSITISDLTGTSAASGSTTFTITTNATTSGNYYWINAYYDGECNRQCTDPIAEMKGLVSAMVEDFLEKYR